MLYSKLVDIGYAVIVFDDTAFKMPFEKGIEAFSLGVQHIVRSLSEINRRNKSLIELLYIQSPGFILDTFPALGLIQRRSSSVTVLHCPFHLSLHLTHNRIIFSLSSFVTVFHLPQIGKSQKPVENRERK